ncbi:ABC transporter ATP-binding protein [Nakamurella antarctica]|uniref:ABC transporter ATP-binding protein n=1 Tax=Nakamurella antarctica TaxID=1902245 RepID=A0A3G8ZK29_9ACTN|nr:ABC transporter ATP-binding protein [Nakamurella antarctica]AZI57538.1 ABC transporter ATP-binding protein [Nakamurella antarctica]
MKAALATASVDVSDLFVSAGNTELIAGVSFSVAAGESVAIVGESGSGKSLTLKSIAGILPAGVRITSGSAGVGGRAALIPQEPLSALDPLMPVGKQITEICRYVAGLDRKRASARTRELLEQVGLGYLQARTAAYPHQLSGGERQRALIAMALASNPDVLLCDEPTTALDVTVAAQVLGLIERLQRDLGLTILFVSHDIAVVSHVCSRILVMRAGVVVEDAPTGQLVDHPAHPYTKQLLSAVLEVPELGPRHEEGTTL